MKFIIQTPSPASRVQSATNLTHQHPRHPHFHLPIQNPSPLSSLPLFPLQPPAQIIALKAPKQRLTSTLKHALGKVPGQPFLPEKDQPRRRRHRSIHCGLIPPRRHFRRYLCCHSCRQLLNQQGGVQREVVRSRSSRLIGMRLPSSFASLLRDRRGGG